MSAHATMTREPGFWGLLTVQEQATLRDSQIIAAKPFRRDHLLEYQEMLLQQGTAVDHVAIVRSGWMKATASNSSGQEAMLRLYGPGSVIGATQAMTGRAAEETVTTCRPSAYLMAFSAKRFRDFINHAPNAQMALLSMQQEQMEEADRIRAIQAAPSGLQRLSGLLVELCRDRNQPARHPNGTVTVPPVPLSQQELADWIGDSRKTVVRALAELRDRRIASRKGGHIVIEGIDALHLCAASDPRCRRP